MAIFVPHAGLARLLGASEVRSQASTVGALLEEVRALVTEQEWELARRAAVLVNGRHVHHLKGMSTPLKDDDEVWMVFPAAGG